MVNQDKKQVQKLAICILAVLVIYLASSVLHQYLIAHPYRNVNTGAMEVLDDKAILVLAPCAITALVGKIYNRTLPQTVAIPQKNSFICALIVFISTITYTWAAAKTSFPVVMAFKSCNLISVLLVAVLCTRVKEKSLKLDSSKIVIGVIVSAGVFLFSFFDPEVEGRTKANQAIGIALLFVSLIADGFLPDFQAEIKSVYKPEPTQMMAQINKWVAILSLVSILGSFTTERVFAYVITHPIFIVHLVGMSALSCVGQFVIYYMIKQFKQHIVPFVITLRKIFTVCLNIVFFGHQSSWIQLCGVLIVVVVVVYEFSTQTKTKDSGHIQINQIEKFQMTEELQEQNSVFKRQNLNQELPK